MKERLVATHFIEQYNGKYSGDVFFTNKINIQSLHAFISHTLLQDGVILVAIFKIKYK